MERFYVLDRIHACDLRLFAGGQWVNQELPGRCPECGWLGERSLSPTFDIALNHLGRHGFAEYLWNSHSLPIFREDLIELWQRERFTGMGVEPVRITGWYERPRKALPASIPAYYRLATDCKARLVEPPPVGGPCRACGCIAYAFPKIGARLPNGLGVDLASWVGADLFGLTGYGFVFCTRRVAEATLREGYSKHIAFARAGDYCRWDEFSFSRWTSEAYRRHVGSFLIRRAEDL